jgi:hypothetical protein
MAKRRCASERARCTWASSTADGSVIERYGAEFDGDSGEGGVELRVLIRA